MMNKNIYFQFKVLQEVTSIGLQRKCSISHITQWNDIYNTSFTIVFYNNPWGKLKEKDTDAERKSKVRKI